MTQVAHAERGHCELAPSAAARWVACPGSVRLSRGIPRVSSSYADEGTRAHEIAEAALRTGIFAPGEDEEIARGLPLFTAHCQDLMEKVRDSSGLYPAGYLIEAPVSLERLNPPFPMYGTCDFIAWSDGVLEVVDLKWGKGVRVDPEQNQQLMYYGAGALLELDHEARASIDSVTLTIIQPRTEDPVRQWTLSPLDLIEGSLDLITAALRTAAPNAELVPGDHCRFCPAHGICPAQAQKALAVAGDEFAADLSRTLSLPAADALSPQHLGGILDRLGVLDDWIRAVRERAHALIQAGTPVPGWKLVAKRGLRKWVDEKEVFAWGKQLGLAKSTLMAKPELKSPAQMEKIAQVPEHLWTKQSSGETLAPESDARAAVNPVEFAADLQIEQGENA